MQARFREPTDEDAIADLARSYVAEFHPHMTFSEEATRQTFRASLRGVDVAIYLLEDADGEPIGFMLASVMWMVFTASVCAMMGVLYVEPEHRGADAEQMLLAAFDAWARRCGAAETMFAAPAGASNTAFAQFATHGGYTPVGALMGRASGAAYVC